MDYFSVPLKRQVVLVPDLVNSCRISVGNILLVIEFEPVVSNTLFSVRFCVPCHPFVNSQDETKSLSGGFLSELLTSVYPGRTKSVLGFLEV